MKGNLPILAIATGLFFLMRDATAKDRAFPKDSAKGFVPGNQVNNIVSDLPRHKTRRYGTRRRDQITDIVIHHSAGPQTQTPLQIAKYHVGPNHISSQGIPGIAYHYVITPDGQIFQTNFLETVSWHVKNHNTKSIGICLIGNFEKHTPTKSQYDSLVYLVKGLYAEFSLNKLERHKFYRPGTLCPGRYFDYDLVKRRLGAAASIARTPVASVYPDVYQLLGLTN